MSSSALDNLLLIVAGAVVIWLVILTVWFFRIWRHYNRLINGTAKQSLSQILERLLNEIKSAKKGLTKLETDTDRLRKRSRSFVQKVKLLRYNPFKDVGGDQSFIIALLDEEKNGVVISSLHARDKTRWFAKQVVSGKGREHKLSQEEKELIYAAS